MSIKTLNLCQVEFMFRLLPDYFARGRRVNYSYSKCHISLESDLFKLFKANYVKPDFIGIKYTYYRCINNKGDASMVRMCGENARNKYTT